MSHPVAEARVDEDISTSERSGGVREEVKSKRSQCGTERRLIEWDSPGPCGHPHPMLRARSLDHRRDIVSEKRWKLDLWCGRHGVVQLGRSELRKKRIDVRERERNSPGPLAPGLLL